jgi:hypothetical protein
MNDDAADSCTGAERNFGEREREREREREQRLKIAALV